MGRDCRRAVLIMYWFLVVLEVNVLVSDVRSVLSAECVLGYAAEVALGAEVLG